MADTVATLKLTLGGAMKLLQAAIAKAAEIGVPECISIVDPATVPGAPFSPNFRLNIILAQGE